MGPTQTPPTSSSAVELPEPLSYRVKNKLLGPPLNTARLIHERLGKPTALAVFASDNLSSSAYASEEILRVLLPAVGVAAFSLVVPVTPALLVVLGVLILSYRQTIKAYPTAGGAYIVTRDNFGLLPAQVAGVALLTDYILTVSVSVAAGTAALTSAFSGLAPYSLEIAIAFVIAIAYGNLRGVRESGKVFAVPTYFFILNMAVLLGVGLLKMLFGTLPVDSLNHPGLLPVGQAGNGLFEGAALFVVLHAFASGGAAVTGVEAISNGEPAFKEPAWKNARTTLVIMGTTLGVMFLGLSVLAAKVHATPYESGSPTVISQVGKLVFDGGALGHVLYYSLQAGTMLILVLAANTSFADFPRLASFHAEDNFMPRQLTKRGHRLVFSNGIISLAVTSILLLVITNAKVDRLIPLYAIGVFTSFTLSQAGMAKHHITHKEPHWRTGLFSTAWGRCSPWWSTSSSASPSSPSQDRRLARAAAELVAGITAGGDTEVSVLVPRRQYAHVWHRLLHDHSANAINETLADLPHCSVTIVPYQLRRRTPRKQESPETAESASSPRSNATRKRFDHEHVETPDGCLPIVDAQQRRHVRLAGRVRALRVQPLRGVPTLECTLVDSTGEMVVAFLGRRQIAGVKIGTRMAVEGTVGTHLGNRAILNPAYELLGAAEPVSDPSSH